MGFTTLVLGVCGFLLRAALLNKSSSEWLAKRIEISTPVSSWRRVVEGVTLLDHGYSPYEGDIYHQSPLILAFFRGLSGVPLAVEAVFLLTDLLIAYAFYHIAQLYQSAILAHEKSEKKTYAKGVDQILYKSWDNIGVQVALAYWLNPFAIVTCASRSTTVLTTFMLTWSILAAMRGRLLATCLGLALASHHDPYMAVMAIPLAMLICQKTKSGLLQCIIQTLLVFGALSALLLGLAFHFSGGSWDFVQATYGFVFTVPDFTPNVGVFWYLFTEMFAHFRTFFLWVFQLHVFFYILPAGMRLWRHPFFLVYLMAHVVGLFKSYPAVGDTVLPLTLLCLWRHLFMYVRSLLVISCMFLASIILMPTFWYLWIIAGSGNANFFYSGTLAYNLAHVMLLSGTVTAFLRREFDLKHGTTPPQIDGKPAIVILE